MSKIHEVEGLEIVFCGDSFVTPLTDLSRNAEDASTISLAKAIRKAKDNPKMFGVKPAVDKDGAMKANSVHLLVNKGGKAYRIPISGKATQSINLDKLYTGTIYTNPDRYEVK